MDFFFSEDQNDFRKMCKDFARGEVQPWAAIIDEEERFPFEVFDKLAEVGFLGIVTPEEYGGQGADFMHFGIATEEIGYYCLPTAMLVSSQNCVTSRAILIHGTEEQKKKYVPPLANGIVDGKRQIGAFALTEPDAGSDATGTKTKAVLKGDHYIINGYKRFITNGSVATMFVVFAVAENGPAAFIVESNFPGFSVGKEEKKMGIRGSVTTEIMFDDCIVPKENLLGKEGNGFRIALSILDEDRAGLSLAMVGMAQRAIDESVKYSKERVQFGKRLSQFQNTQFTLAEMQAKTDAARLLAYRAVDAIIRKDPNASAYASMAKLICADNVNDVTRRAVQIHGGYGYCREYPVEKLLRDAKICEIMMGTNEIQKLVISKAMGVR